MAGTTACVSIVLDCGMGLREFFVANVGDSRAIVCRESSKAEDCSVVERQGTGELTMSL